MRGFDSGARNDSNGICRRQGRHYSSAIRSSTSRGLARAITVRAKEAKMRHPTTDNEAARLARNRSEDRFWFGHQGSEYLDLGRFWQYLLAVGLVFWLFLMFRALRPTFKNPEKRELSSLFLYTAVAIPVFYLPALFYGPQTNFAVIDNWRFWIIHLWVEGFFELFATVLVAIMFHQMGVVSTKAATRLIYLDAILYLSGGIIGTGHHWYFTGQGRLNMGLASCFSALEVVPLTLLTLDAWDFIKLRKAQCSACGHDLAWGQKWSIYFLMAVG